MSGRNNRGDACGNGAAKQRESKTQVLDLERARVRTLPRRLNVPLDLEDDDFEGVEEIEDGESSESLPDSSLRLCDGTGK